MNEKIKLIIADDHVHFRKGITATINEDNRMEVIAQAANATQLIENVHVHNPDVVVTDLVMPGNGIMAINQLVGEGFVRIIVVSAFEDADIIVEALEAGAMGYVGKNAEREEIISAILQVYRFKPHYSNSTSSLLMKEIVDSAYNPYKRSKQADFDETEIRVINLICRGKTIEEISSEIFASPRKVSRIKRKIAEKMGVSNAVGMLFYAIKTGVLTLKDFC